MKQGRVFLRFPKATLSQQETRQHHKSPHRSSTTKLQNHPTEINKNQRCGAPRMQTLRRRTLSECPSNIATHFPEAASQTLTLLSHDPETTRSSFEKTATHTTYAAESKETRSLLFSFLKMPASHHQRHY
jgi:hypothetical protein